MRPNQCFTVGKQCHKALKKCSKNIPKIDQKSSNKLSKNPFKTMLQDSAQKSSQNVQPKVPQGHQNGAQILPRILLEASPGSSRCPKKPQASHRRAREAIGALKNAKIVEKHIYLSLSLSLSLSIYIYIYIDIEILYIYIYIDTYIYIYMA